jgi:Protein of unknown function (DUF550)
LLQPELLMDGREEEKMIDHDHFNLIGHLYRQREWSERTFGPGPRVDGIIDHFLNEMKEVIKCQGEELEEWIDMVILALDGAWRAGFEPAEIAAALQAKQQKNEQREWPDWRTAETGKAIEHVRTDAEQYEHDLLDGYAFSEVPD